MLGNTFATCIPSQMSLSAWELPVDLQWQWRHAALVSCMFRNQDAAQCAALLTYPSITDTSCASLLTYAVPSFLSAVLCGPVPTQEAEEGLGQGCQGLEARRCKGSTPPCARRCASLCQFACSSCTNCCLTQARRALRGGPCSFVLEHRNSTMLCAERCHFGPLLLLTCSCQQCLLPFQYLYLAFNMAKPCTCKQPSTNKPKERLAVASGVLRLGAVLHCV